MANIFDKFVTGTKKVKIKALDNAEIEIRELTVSESNEFFKRLIKGMDAEGKADIDMNQMTEIRLEKVALAMIEPKMSVEDLRALSSKANEALNEISDAIDSFSEKGK